MIQKTSPITPPASLTQNANLQNPPAQKAVAADPAASRAAVDVCLAKPSSAPNGVTNLNFLDEAHGLSACVEQHDHPQTALQQFQGPTEPKNQEKFETSLKQMLAHPGLDPQLKGYFETVYQRALAIHEAKQNRDPARLQSLLSEPLRSGTPPVETPVRTALEDLNRAVAFMQNMSNGDPDLAIRVINSRSVEHLSELNQTFLTTLAGKQVNQDISALQQRFSQRLESPAYRQALLKAMVDAGVSEQELTRISSDFGKVTDTHFIGHLPTATLQKVADALRAQEDELSHWLNANPHAAQTQELTQLREALHETNQDLPQVYILKSKFDLFHGMMQVQVDSLKQEILGYVQHAGLQVPDAVLQRFLQSPATSSHAGQNTPYQELVHWIEQAKTSASNRGDNDALQLLNGLDQLAMQLNLGGEVSYRVQHGIRVDDSLIEDYTRFQSLVLVKNTLIRAFDQGTRNGGNNPKITQAVLDFGNRFADWMSLPQSEFEQAVSGWLSQYVDPSIAAQVRTQLGQIRAGLQLQNDMGQMFSPTTGPQPSDSHEHSDWRRRHMADMGRCDSQILQGIYQTRGWEGLRQALERERREVLEPLSHNLEQMNQALGLLGAAMAQQDPNELLKAIGPESKPSTREAPAQSDELLEAQMQRLQKALAAHLQQDQLQKAVLQIRDALIHDIGEIHHQQKALRAVQKARAQITQQIFELQRSRNADEQRYQLQFLQSLDRHLAEFEAQKAS